MVDILNLLRKVDVDPIDLGDTIGKSDEYTDLITQWFVDNNISNASSRVLINLLMYYTPSKSQLQDNRHLYERIMWVLGQPIRDIQNEVKHMKLDPSYFNPMEFGPELAQIFNPQEWMNLVDKRGQIPKYNQDEVKDDEKQVLKNYTNEINELRHAFIEELKKINPTHRGGTIQTVKLKAFNREYGRDRMISTLEDMNFLYNDEINDTMSNLVDDIINNRGIEVNAFGKLNMKQGYAILSITTNGDDIRKIVRSFRAIKASKLNMSAWNYDETGKFIMNSKESMSKNEELVRAKDGLYNLPGTTKTQIVPVNDSKTPIEIGWPHGTNDPTDQFKSSGRWNGINSLNDDIFIGSLRGDFLRDNKGKTYYNPIVTKKFFEQSADKVSYLQDILNNESFELPHLYISISGIQPNNFPSQEIARILNKAILDYVTDLHALFIEEGYPKIINDLRKLDGVE